MTELETRQNVVKAYVEFKLPDFAKGVRLVSKLKKGKKLTKMIIHQDAFGADYQEDEFYLLGCAIKYAGEFGVEVLIHGKNRSTIQ